MAASAPTPVVAVPDPGPWPCFNPRTSLRARAGLAFGLAGLLLTGVGVTVGTALLRADLERRVAAQHEFLAGMIGDALEQTVYERLQELRLVARTATARTATADELRRELDTLLDRSADLAWVGFVAADARVAVGTQHALEGADFSSRPVFRAARSQPYVGPVKEFPEVSRVTENADATDVRFVELGVPLVGGNAQFEGIAVAYLRASWGANLLRAHLAEGMRRDHVTIALYGTEAEPLCAVGSFGWTEAPAAPPVARTARGTQREYPTAGEAYLTSFVRTRPVPEFRGLNWLVAVRQPVDDVFGPVVRLRAALLISGAIVTLVLTLAGWLLAAPISRELRRITVAARRIEDGDVLALLPSHPGNSELARATNALRVLVERLRRR